MFVHKFKNDPKELLTQRKEIVKSDADTKYIHRVTLVNLMLCGAKADELAEYSGCGESTLQ